VTELTRIMTFVLCLLVAALGADTQQRVNPVEKVTTLLLKIQGEIEGEGKEEAASYDKYACFCKEQADNKQYAIENFNEQIAVLEGKIENKKAMRDKLNSEITDLGTEIDGVTSDQESAQGIRTSELEAYTSRAASLADAVEKMKGAIKAMEAMAASVSGGALVEKYKSVIKSSVEMARALHIEDKKVTSLLQQDQEPAGYTSHSNEVISTLQSLLKLFKQKKVQADQEEQSTRQEFEMASGARRNTIKALEKAKSEKSAASAQLDQEVNAHETEKTETEYSRDADGTFLQDLTSKCEAKAENFHSRSETRTAELTAIAGALEMLKGDVAKMYPATDLGLLKKRAVVQKTATAIQPLHGHWVFVADKPDAPAKAAPSPKAVDVDDDDDHDDDDESDDDELSFLQLNTPKSKVARKKMINFLAAKAEALKSAALSTLLIKMRDTPSPFAKVKQMINDLITRLEDEAAAEAGQKEWCDEEMTSATGNRDAAQLEIETLSALKTEKSSLVDSLSEQIMTLSQEIADLQKALNEETVLRENDAAQNNMTIADATAGKEAVANAIEILNSFYNPAFIQQAPSNTAEGYERFVAEGAGADGKTVDDMAPGAGEMGEYGGKTDASKSIIGLLEVIKSDFENSISKTETDEDVAQGAYDTFKSDTETDITDKGTLKDTKESEKETALLDITQAEADLKSQNEALKLALEELEKLKPVCVDSGMSYEERTARRLQEVDSLKQALKILQETDFGF
jgi:hypothetical protein